METSTQHRIQCIHYAFACLLGLGDDYLQRLPNHSIVLQCLPPMNYNTASCLNLALGNISQSHFNKHGFST